MTLFTSTRVLRTARAGWLRAACALALVAATGCSPAADPASPDDSSDDDSSEDDGDDDKEQTKPSSSKDAGAGKPPKTTTDPSTETPVVKADAGAKPTGDAGKAASGGDTSTYCAAKPVLAKYCISCHDGAGTSGSPMGLTKPSDFTVAAPVSKGKTVAEAVSARTHDTAKPMPPKGVLKGADIAALDAWIAAGTPGSDDTTCSTGGEGTPKPDENGRVDGWDPTACDKIYELRSHGTGTSPYSVPPGQEVHPQIALDAPWGSEKVQAIGFKPYTDNKKVLHHWILNGAGRTFLAGWAPGDEERPPFPKDVGMEMPTGRGAFTLDMHYNSLQENAASMDASGVDICTITGANLRPKVAAVTMGFATIGNGGVLAAAGAKNAPVTGTCNVTASQPVHLLTAAPHAHTLATHMKFTVTKKDKTEIVMHDEDFAFGEQGTYPLAGGEVILETGDVVKTTCYYTNPSARNVTFGESTTNEMCFNFALYYPKGALSCGGLGGGGIAFPTN
ncbi:MAG: hypothetical protein RLZZ450_6511 [Pseudomonadota bacterium]|jgi:mono/diheme cytochrome c family protein